MNRFKEWYNKECINFTHSSIDELYAAWNAALASQWRPMSEEIPADVWSPLLLDKKGNIHHCWRTNDGCLYKIGATPTIKVDPCDYTHWMEVPKV